MFDEDFSSVCGEFADLDGDGTVDMEEYLNEEDDYNRIMGISFVLSCGNKVQAWTGSRKLRNPARRSYVFYTN